MMRIRIRIQIHNTGCEEPVKIFLLLSNSAAHKKTSAPQHCHTILRRKQNRMLNSKQLVIKLYVQFKCILYLSLIFKLTTVTRNCLPRLQEGNLTVHTCGSVSVATVPLPLASTLLGSKSNSSPSCASATSSITLFWN